MGDVLRDDGEEHDLLVQHFIVRQVVNERRGRVIGSTVHEDGRARDADRRFRREIGEQHLERHPLDRKSTPLDSSHGYISYAGLCLRKKKNNTWMAGPTA